MQAESSELVSIVIPAYNPGREIAEAVASAKAQTYSSIEIIVVDDGTTDPASLGYIEAAAAHAHVCIRQPNRGLAAARNAGFAAARGTYVVPLDSDDIIAPTYVSECLALQGGRPGFVYTDYELFGAIVRPNPTPEYNFYTLLDENFLTYAALLRKEDWAIAGGYDENLRAYEDWEFWLRMGSRGTFGIHLPRTLFRYRKHARPSLYDFGLSRHQELTAYIRSKHPDLYGEAGRAAVKSRWSPVVCVSAPEVVPQTLLDVQVTPPLAAAELLRNSRANAFIVSHAPIRDRNAAEWAALAVWSGSETMLLPGGATLWSRAALAQGEHSPAERKPAPRKRTPARFHILHQHLANAELLSREIWLRRPGTALTRLLPLRLKERVNGFFGRQVFDLSFYLRFQPNSLLLLDKLIPPLVYFPEPGLRRAALVTPHLDAGGAESILLELASVLRQAGWELLVLATQSAGNAWEEKWRSVSDHVYDMASITGAQNIPAAAYTIITNWKCELVVVQNTMAGYSVLPLLKKERPHIRIAELIHAVDERWDQIRAVEAARHAIDLHIATADDARRELLSTGIAKDKVKLVRNGVDPSRFSVSPAPPHPPWKILFAGRLDPVKRPEYCIAIARELLALRPDADFQFIIAGDGPLRATMQAGVRRRGLDPMFRFLGHVPDISPVLEECHLLLLTSRSEGLPLVVLEALASARPVIAAAVGAIGEAVDDSCGRLIERGTKKREIAAFAREIHALLSDRDLRNRLGSAGREKILRDFDITTARETYRRLFE